MMLRYVLIAATVVALVPAAGLSQGGARGGARGGAQPGQDTAAPSAVIGRVRVTKRAANVHLTPSSTAIVLVNVPQGTELNIFERRGVWLAVELTAALRKQATPVRWYRNETRGFMHISTVEALQ